ncbi:hypothetical protein HDU97_000167 [Phlyctochytrium planicorne]|nr:hypothetical protein HDU97_000167 [Phlyctochytrium planicorne]
MLHLAFPADLLPGILIHSGDIGNAIKIESIFLGLPHQHVDASTAYDALRPQDFPASMALTIRSIWDSSDLAGGVNNKQLSLCHIYWIIKFRPHILMWSKGKLWQRAALQGSLHMFKALYMARWTHGFPLAVFNKAVEAGNIDAVEFLSDKYERIENEYNDSPTAKAAGNGHLHMLKYLKEKKRMTLGGRELATAIESGQMAVIQYLLPTAKVLPDHMYAAGKSGNVKVVKLLLSHERWGQVHMRFLKNAALDGGHYSLFELVCMNSDFNSIQISVGKLKSLVAGDGDVFVHCGGPQQFQVDLHQIANILYNGNARLARILHTSNTDYSASSLEEIAARGHLECVKILMQHSTVTPNSQTRALEVALTKGHFDIAEYLFSQYPTANVSLDRLVEAGNLEIIMHVFKHYSVEGSNLAMEKAAELGFFSILEYLHMHSSYGCSTEAIDMAAGNGHLEIVIWLHTHRTDGCTVKAMDTAAGNGHLSVVEWLHLNRSEGCSPEAMDSASKNGHLHVVKWLHENRSEGCSTEAMDNAAANNHLRVVKFLHFHRFEGCTAAAIDRAAMSGSVDIIQFLVKYREEGGTKAGLENAILGGHLDVLRILLPIVGEKELDYKKLFFNALKSGDIDIVHFLLEEELLESDERIMGELVDHGYFNEAMWLHKWKDGLLTFAMAKTLHRKFVSAREKL